LCLSLGSRTVFRRRGQSGFAGDSGFDLGVSYTAKVAKISMLSNSDFVLNGASVDGVYWLGDRVKKLGVAFDFNGEAATNIQPGVNLSQISLVAGPRYTFWRRKSTSLGPSLYGQALVGFVHAFNSEFPESGVLSSSASSFALQTGGGLKWRLTHRTELRVIQADYILTKLPNNADTYQGDARFSTGVICHF
jgi:hypothetical protein